MNRPGLFAASWSIRFQTTAEAEIASELSEMNTRPVPVAAHSVLVSVGVRSIAATALPARLPQAADVSRLDGAPPMGTKSPQFGSLEDVVNSGQFASRYSRLPAQSCVRQTLKEPWKMVPQFAGCGSPVTGGEKNAASGLA